LCLATDVGRQKEIEMPTFAKCSECAELLTEQYGATVLNQCVNCAEAERSQAAALPSSTASSQPRYAETLQPEAARVERRRNPRIGSRLACRLRARSGSYGVTLVDLSAAGARLRGPCDLPDDLLLLELPGSAALHPAIAWRAGSELGVSFAETQAEVIAVLPQAAPGSISFA
jgi:PilZ domain